MRELRREPALLGALLIVIGLVLAFIVYPQLKVATSPGPNGYVDFLTGVATFDLGESYYTNTPITEEIRQRLPDSIELVVMGLAVALVIGLVVGGLAAYFQSRWPDKVMRLFISAVQSVPGITRTLTCPVVHL